MPKPFSPKAGILSPAERKATDELLRQAGVEVAGPDDPVYRQGATAIFLNRKAGPEKPKSPPKKKRER